MWMFLKTHVPKKFLYPGIALLLFGGVVFAWWIFRSGQDAINTVTQEKTVCPLNGLKTTKEKAENRPFAVMIENSVPARPQSGIDKADLVYETLAEGGITRMMAVYACRGSDAEQIGPVRSARAYFVDWAEGLDAIYAHAGGSPDGLKKIKDDKVDDIQNYGDGKNFWRSSSRPAPHNLYTSFTGLMALAKKNGYDLKATYKELTFKDDPAEADRPTLQEITVNFSGYNYLVKWVYDKKTNSYSRFLAGSAHKDSITGKQLIAKTVVVMRVKQRPLGSESRLKMTTVGSGEAIIFRDGTAVTGTWEKNLSSDREEFIDDSGNQIALTAGLIWIEVVKLETKIDY